jgi:hypothetical protein
MDLTFHLTHFQTLFSYCWELRFVFMQWLEVLSVRLILGALLLVGLVFLFSNLNMFMDSLSLRELLTHVLLFFNNHFLLLILLNWWTLLVDFYIAPMWPWRYMFYWFLLIVFRWWPCFLCRLLPIGVSLGACGFAIFAFSQAMLYCCGLDDAIV